jgi:predicted nicotinamide N-methyase
MLALSGRTMIRNFSVPRGDNKILPLAITSPAVRAQGLNLTVWTSGFVLAGLLHKLSVDYSSSEEIPALELGAGTGIVGLTAAALYKVPVILTDLPPIVPALADNVKLNAETVKETVRCGSLDWSAPESLVLQDGTVYEANKHKAHVILAADTVYSEEHPELLTQTIVSWLAPGSKSRVILTYSLRVAYLDEIRKLWDLLEAAGLEAIDHGQQEDDNAHNWDDECLCEWSVWKWKPRDETLENGNS